MSSWIGDLAANGIGAAIGASLGGLLAYAIGRQQIRQAKLEECLTINRDLAVKANKLLLHPALLVAQGSIELARENINLAEVEGVTRRAESLLTLIEVHAPELSGDANHLAQLALQAHLVCWSIRMHTPPNMEACVDQSKKVSAINGAIKNTTADMHRRLLAQASTVSRFRRWRTTRTS